MDDIFIEISAMKSKASQLQELSRRISCVVNNLNSARFQLADVWKDESFSEFDYEFFRELTVCLTLRQMWILWLKSAITRVMSIKRQITISCR